MKSYVFNFINFNKNSSVLSKLYLKNYVIYNYNEFQINMIIYDKNTFLTNNKK